MKAGLIIAAALIFLIALFAYSFAFGSGGGAETNALSYEQLNYEETTITDSSVSDFMELSAENKNKKRPTDGIIATKDHFLYVFLCSVGGNYTLGADFKITAKNWSTKAPDIANGCTLDGNQRTIWNAAKSQNASATTSVLGGLVSVNNGTIKNLHYYFTGNLTAKKNANSESLAVGGMIGKNGGTVQNCTIVVSGDIETEGQEAPKTDDQGNETGYTGYTGGVIGYSTGRVEDSEITSSVSINATTDIYESDDDDKTLTRHAVLAAGGVVGKMGGGSIVNCKIKSSANVIASDATDTWQEWQIPDEVSGYIQKIPYVAGIVEEAANAVLAYAYNDKEHVHPAGVVIGTIGGGGSIKASQIEALGSAISYGMAGSSNSGSIAGGVVGLLDDTCTASAGLQSNHIEMNCALNSFWMQDFSIVGSIISEFRKRNITCYMGACFGKCNATKLNFKNNFLYVSRDSGIVEDGAHFDSEDTNYVNEVGLICGDTGITSLVGDNNWLVRKLAECDTDRIAGNGENCGALKQLSIYGDGEIKVQGTIEDGKITVRAKPVCSPFYGWTSEIGAESPSFQKEITKDLIKTISSTQYAVFIDDDVQSSGELTQLAKDINLIKEDAWSKRSVTLSWLTVHLGKDILVEKGTPVIEDFYGKFLGDGHKISFAAGSSITHDYQQPVDDTEHDPNVPDYNEINTGLFGTIMPGAEISNLNVAFGGSITDKRGFTFNRLEVYDEEEEETYSASDLLKQAKINYNGAENGVATRIKTTDEFTLPDKLEFDRVYVYFLTGDNYNADKEFLDGEYNPGYVEIVPYIAQGVVDTHNVGILAGKNLGRIENVNVEATKSSAITISAHNVRIGNLCGENQGVVTDASTTSRGKVTAEGRGEAFVGGLFGINSANKDSETTGLTSFVGGEVKIKTVKDYHVISVFEYRHATYVSDLTKEPELPEGYTKIAAEYTSDNTTTRDSLRFGCSAYMAVKTFRVENPDPIEDFIEAIGSLFGAYSGIASPLTDASAVSGEKGEFNTKVYQPDKEGAFVGGVIGYLDTSTGKGAPTFTNVWAAMSYSEYQEDGSGRLAIGSGSVGVKTGVNFVYVKQAIVLSEVDSTADLPVSFTLEAREGMTFSGWYDYTSGERQVITTGLIGTVFTPQTRTAADYIYVAEVINLQLETVADLKLLSASTNEGRGYLDVSFTIGSNLTLSDFTPIGTEAHPFLGSVNGNGFRITISMVENGSLAGLFGCIGEEGKLTNITVCVAGEVGLAGTTATGAIAAINKGTIGQDRSTGKVIAEIKNTMKGKYVGGGVGINDGEIKNVEVHFLYQNSLSYGTVMGASNDSQTVCIGGAVGYNRDGTAKNIIVEFEGATGVGYVLPPTGKAYALGGVIGKNGAEAAAYSLVSVVKDDAVLGAKGSDGDQSKYRGFIIGYNESEKTDGLWTLYQSQSLSSAAAYAPELGAPVSVYTGGEPNAHTASLVLVNGEGCEKGNILIRYGKGSVEVSIGGYPSEKGGEITFLSAKVEGGVDFYDYVADFASGERVSLTEGNAGYVFSPTVGEAESEGLIGKVYYAAFCDSSIGSQDDYKAVQANIAADYRLYVEYNLTASFTVDASTATSAIGDATHPFCGLINGNGYTVTLSSSESMHAFVGVLGDSADSHFYSAIRNLRLVVQCGSKIEEVGADVSRGFLTDVNYGTISGVNLLVRGYIKNLNGAAGAVTGENHGLIASATVLLDYANYLGADGFGALIGKTVGAVAGVNYGKIAGERANAIDVTIKKSGSYGGVVYGREAAGAVVGLNETGGEVGTAIVNVSGALYGKEVSALVGVNKGKITDAFVTLERGALYFGTAHFGVIAALNEGEIGFASEDYSAVIKGYVYASPTVGEAISITLETETDPILIATTPAASTTVIGGVGYNKEGGSAVCVLIELHAAFSSTEIAGGIAGDNAGEILYASLLTTAGADILSEKAGGIVGVNEDSGEVKMTFATTRGAIGDEHAIKAGGFAAENFGDFRSAVISIYDDVYGEHVGLAAATSTGLVENCWAQVCNSSTAVMCETEGSGFNLIRVLNETLLAIDVDYGRELISFTSQISGVKEWYIDISAWTASSGILTEGINKTKLLYSPASDVADQICYVCYDDLTIRNYSAFRNLATIINSRDYYHGVLFRLGENVTIPAGTVLRPIGTEEHPFEGIFDGGYHTITLEKGSGISGATYAGLFGYTAEGSRIENFLLVIESGVTIGSVTSYEIGALVGRNASAIKNVFVNLSAKLTYNSKRRYAGAMIGRQAEGAPYLVNSWVSILNGEEPAIGNMTEQMSFGVNYVGVLGNGETRVEYEGDYATTPSDIIRFRTYVPTKNKTAFTLFGGWFSDIRTGVKIQGQDGAATVTGLGEFVFNSDLTDDNPEISFTPFEGVSGQTITLSFISLTISNAEEWRIFANNVNTYGDQKAVFTLLNDITVDYSEMNCPSVGTLERPFTGTFDGASFKITVVGDLTERDYAAVFGFVGEGGLVKDVIIDGSGATFGDGNALYSAVAVGLLFGEIRNVVAEADDKTVVYTTQGLASSGGLVGRAGKIGENGESDISYKIDNSWLVLGEGATVTNAVGEDPDLSHPDYYRTNKAVRGVGRVMQIVGEGVLDISIEEGGIFFDAVDNGSKFYGFIDNNAVNEASMTPIYDAGNAYAWTVCSGDHDKAGNSTSSYMLCVIVNKIVENLADLMQVAENVSKGRNYRGITYTLSKDIVIGTEWDDPKDGIEGLVPLVFTPIGGEVVIGEGSGYTGYVERDFIGGFDGQGHTITFEAGVKIDARYAGLFGRVGATARIRNLVVQADCKIGVDTGDNTTRTLYAGVLAAYAAGGTYENVAVIMDRHASLYGSVGTGRAFGYLPREAGNVATNCWAVSYNSKANFDLNAAEIAYNEAFDADAFALGTTPNVGSNQGGFNTLMVVAAGEIRLNIPESGMADYYFSFDTSYWYALNDFNGAYETKPSGNFNPDASASRMGYNVSFLKDTISSVEELQSYGKNINDGYNFYHLTFKLTSDITIKEKDDFTAIGTPDSGLNGTLDGQGYTITIDEDAVIGGEYAGLFGYVAAEGLITNLRVVVKGTFGKNHYDAEQVAAGAKNALYAGAVAYNAGKLENVIVIAEGGEIKTKNGYAGLVIGYDRTNLVKNVWALVDASSFLDTVGRSAAGDTGVNTMKIIGVGTVNALFEDVAHGDARVRFVSTSAVPVMGWYKSFEKNQQISSAMLSGGSLANGASGHLLAPTDLFGETYEVAVIKTTITSALDLIAVAGDVNIGGYSFENITFSLGADVTIPTTESAVGYLPIGTTEHTFKGTFLGSLDGTRYTITVKKDTVIGGVFGCNAGTIRDLTVVVKGTVGEQTSTSDQVYGVVAAINKGRIESTYVEIAETGRVVGYTVGGIAGRNTGTISDCVVVVKGEILAETASGNAVNAGGIVGLNEGTVEGTTDFSAWKESGLLPAEALPYVFEANLYLYGRVAANASSVAIANAGGAIGNHYNGTAVSLILCQTETGVVSASSLGTGAARTGAYVGYARSSLNHSAVFLFGEIESTSYAGGTAGYLDGVTALNVWQVTKNVTMQAAGEGSKSVNRLTIKGNGKLKASVDTNRNVIFINITEANGSEIDGWYTAPNVEVDAKTGNVGENRATFLPVMGVQNKSVTVIFVNTEIRTAEDLADMASSVSGGLSGDDIVFTLMNDITVDAGILTTTIGSAEYPFRNVFDGQGFTITLKDGALPSGDIVALFGYTGADSTIRNLGVHAEAGTYGSVKSERTALLVAYHQGVIENVTITVDAGALLVGQTAGTLAASSFGSVRGATLTFAGKVDAKGSDNTAIAGGLIGVNDGALSAVTATFVSGSEIVASEAITTYAGAVAGENYEAISLVTVTYGGKLIADGRMTSYSGVVAGLNLGYVEKAYVLAEGGGFEKGISGGLVGNNVNSLSTSLLRVEGRALGAVDSLVGNYASQTVGSKVHNVWVYSDRVTNVSRATCTNSMIYEAGRVLSCPTAEEVLAGKIAFSAAITADGKKFDLFAAVSNGEYAAGSGAAMDHFSYADGKITYLADEPLDEEDKIIPVVNVRVCLTSRDLISSGEELYAFALAVNSGEYAFESASIFLGADFTLPERAFPAIHLPATITVSGDHHVVSVGDATLTGGLFAENEGTIKNIGLRLTKAETTSFAYDNAGTIRNAVVYLERGASVAGGNYFAVTNVGTVENAWLVVRETTAIGQGAVPYAVLKINGVGSLTQGGEGNALTFTASTAAEEGMIFVGYTSAGVITSSAPLFDTADKPQALYSAEFLSTYLDTDYKLQVLSDVSMLGYRGEGQTFLVTADLTVSASLFGLESAPFLGTIDGKGHTLTVSALVENSVLGTFAGEVRDLVIDLGALSAGEVKIFDGTLAVRLNRVVIQEKRDSLYLGAPTSATGVWIETDSSLFKSAFLTTNAYDTYSLLYKNGAASYDFSIAGKILVSAADSAEQVFAGYFGEKGGVLGTVGKEKTFELGASAANLVTLNYINRTLSSADDLIRLANGVQGGFDFDGATFLVKDGGFTVSEGIPTIGDAAHPFKGSILGGANAQITYASYGGGDTFLVRPFLDKLYGSLGDLIFRYEQGATFEGTPALVTENLGVMSAVVVRSENENLFAGGAGLTIRNGGEIVNSWLVTRGTESAVKEGSLVGVNELRFPYERVNEDTVLSLGLTIGLSKASQGTKVVFGTLATPGRFVCFYDYDGKVIFPGNYNYSLFTYTAPVTSTGVRITVRIRNSVSQEDELVYLGYQSADNLQTGSVIYLADDLTVERHLNTLTWNELVLDLAGHSLTLAATGEGAETLLSGGTVRNGSIYLRKGYYGIAAAGATLENVALFLADEGMTLPAYDVSGDKGVTVVVASPVALTASAGKYRFLYAPKGAKLQATFTGESYQRSFVGEDNDLYYYGGKEDGETLTEEIACFAPVTLRSAEDYAAFVRAANRHDAHLAHAEITLAANIEVNGESIPATLTYAGKLYAGGHLVTITGGTFGATYLNLEGEGAVTDLALAFKGATITQDTLLVSVEAEGSRIALVVYQGASAKQVETDALVVNVYGQGEVRVTFGDKIRFTAVQSGNYALREWKDDEGESLGNDLVYDGEAAASAHFELRYLVRIEFTGVDSDVLAKNASNLPFFKGFEPANGEQSRIYFASDIEGAHAPITVELVNIGEGFLFRSLSASSVGASVTPSASDAWSFSLLWTIGTYEIVLHAELTYVEMTWEKITYDAAGHRGEELADLRAALEAQGLTVEYEYTPLGATPALVENAPYHAGTYLVSFRVKSTAATGKKVLCDAYCGLEIEPKVLRFKSLEIEDKEYDGTADATLKALSLDGFCGSDGDYIKLDGLTFAFADANAEQGKRVYVSGDAYLAYDPTQDAEGAKRYVYLNYAFSKESLSSESEGEIRANITRRVLNLTVQSKEVEYLEQFDEEGKPLPIDYSLEVNSGLVEADAELFQSYAATLITRENKTSYDVGYYRIIVGDSLALQNYQVKLTDTEAYYVVTPSEITVIFDSDEMTYGDKVHAPRYHLADDVKIRPGDSLVFSNVVYNEGKELVPSEERYSFTCTFSAKNKNYVAKVAADDYVAEGGVLLPILRGQSTLKVNPKTVTVVGDDDRNTKRIGKRSETLHASLASGSSFVSKDHALVVSREAGEKVGSYKLTYAVKDGNGADVTDRYEIVTKAEGGYFFTVTPVRINLKASKTSIIYGNAVGVIKYGASVEGGGITLGDLYYAIKGSEKADATLQDIGVNVTLGYSAQAIPDVGEYDAEFAYTYANADAESSVSEVTISGTHNMIIVQKRYVTVTIQDYTKNYDGLKDFNESKVKYKVSGILDADKDKVSVKRLGYRLVGDGVSVGVYKIDGSFELSSSSATLANNYYLTVVQGNLIVDPSKVTVNAEVGYFDENGDFTPASIVQGGEDVEYTIYYGDAKAELCFTIASGGSFLKVPDGTDKEKSDYIASTLKIAYNRLNKILPFDDDGKTTASKIGLSSANNNVEATFTPHLSIAAVALTIRVLSTSKVVGESDPEIAYEIIAKDPSDDYRVIPGYEDLTKGTFSVVITADRTEGETLGAYTYENVKVDIVNLYSGESLFDEETETGLAFSDAVSKEVPAELTLTIEQQSFMETSLGKYLIYGGALLVLATGVVLMLIFLPRVHRKRKAKKAEKKGKKKPQSAADVWEDSAENESDESPLDVPTESADEEGADAQEDK